MSLPRLGEGEITSLRTLEMVSQVRVGNLDAFGRAEQVERQLEAAISIGILSDGERFPPELALAEQLGVSALTLRQSLALLRNKGLIETRRGRGGGSYVSGHVSLTESDIQAQLSERRTDDIRDLGDLAASATASAARLAAARSDDQDIHRVQELATAFERAVSADDLRRSDCRLHIGLGVASQSRRLTALIIQVQAEFAQLSWGLAWADHKDAAADHHRQLIDAIERRDSLSAQSIAVQHCEDEAALLINQHLDLLVSRSGSR